MSLCSLCSDRLPCERRVVIVAGDGVGVEGPHVEHVAPVHEAEVGAAVEHEEVDAALVVEDLLQDAFEGLEGEDDVDGGVPVVEPPRPELAEEQHFGVSREGYLPMEDWVRHSKETLLCQGVMDSSMFLPLRIKFTSLTEYLDY